MSLVAQDTEFTCVHDLPARHGAEGEVDARPKPRESTYVYVYDLWKEIINMLHCCTQFVVPLILTSDDPYFAQGTHTTYIHSIEKQNI